jgi:hypothetical protein
VSTETATVGLNLDGTFAAQAERDAAAAEKLAHGLTKAGAAAERTRKPKSDTGFHGAFTKEIQQQGSQEQALYAKIAAFDGARLQKVEALKKRYKDMQDAALGKGGEKSETGEGLGAMALGAAAGLVLAAGAAILSAAKELASAAVDLIRGADELAIAQTSKREVQSAIFGKIGGSYDATVKIAAKYGIDEDKAVEEVKKLLGAKFKSEEIPLLLKLSVGIGAVAGEEKAKAFMEKLAKEQLKGGKASEETVKGFAEAGIDVEQVWKRLATKMGTSVAVAQAKVKAGAVDMKTALEAVKATAGAQFGDIAEKMGGSVPALLMRLKSDVSHLFDNIDLQPFKDVLKNVTEVLEGPSGEALKGGVKELLDAINHAFLDQFRGEEGKQKLKDFARDAASVLHELAVSVKTLQPVIEVVTKLAGAFVLAAGTQFAADLRLVGEAAENLGNVVGWIEYFIDEATELLGLGDQGSEAGGSLVDGFVEGIESKASEAVAAAVAMGEGAMSALKGLLGIASPSKEFAWMGAMSAEGFAGGMAANDTVEASAAGMGKAALGAAGAPSTGAVGSGGAIVFAPQITLPPGSGAEHAAAVHAALAAAYPEFLALVRRAQREGVLPRAA